MAPTAAQNRPATPAREWSAEIAAALAAYRAGEYDAARQQCHALRARPGEGSGRLEADVIEALCLLRSAARAELQEGRTRLAQLAEQDPTLWDEPECNLAIGHALSALSETAEALRTLERAVAGFAVAGLPARQAETLVEFAETWARHAEWELTPASFGVRPPGSPQEAAAVRRAQIDALRAQIEALPDHDAALERFELVRGGFLLDSGLDPGAGAAALERLTSQSKLTSSRASAASRLAEWYERVGRTGEAAGLYERLAKHWQGELAWRAAQRQAELVRPQIELELPASVRREEIVQLGVRARGVPRVSLEVRSVDVEAWLSTQRTRGSELFLAEAGGVQFAREFSAQMEDAFAWWRLDSEPTPPEFRAEPGAYVVIACGVGTDGRTLTVKRLLTVSDLVATCFVGPERVLVWAVAAGQRPTPLTVKFWMNSSFVPVTRELAEDVATFPLPNEARLSRERGWVCLVQAGEHIAVCRGQLPPAGRAVPRAALSVGPPTAAVGQALYIAGLLVPLDGEPLDLGGATELQLEVADTLKRVQLNKSLPLGAGGAFAGELVVPAEAAGRQLRFVARLNEQVLELLGPRPAVSVPRADDPQFRVSFDVPTWLWPRRAVVGGTLRAEYPWGTVPTDAQVELTLRALRLPGVDGQGEPTWGASLADRGVLDAHGLLPFTIPLQELAAPDEPTAIQVSASITSWEGRTGTGQTQVLVAPQQPHVWLQTMPREPAVGAETRIHLGWFAPGALPVAGPPVVEVRRDGHMATRLATFIDEGGYTSESWIPPAIGDYEVTTELPRRAADAADGNPAYLPSVRRTIAVQAAPLGDAAPAAPLRCEAVWEKAGAGVHVGLTGTVPGPLLVLVAGRNPLGAVCLPAVAGHARVDVPVATVAAGARVRVLQFVPGGLEELVELPVPATAENLPALRLSGSPTDVWPGSTAPVRVMRDGAVGTAVLTARLIDATSPPHFQPPGARASAGAADALVVQTSQGSTTQPAPTLGANLAPAARDALDEALRTGETLWCASTELADNEHVLSVPIPAQPGLYRLIAALRTADGFVTTDTLLLDARRGVFGQVELPPRLRVGDRALLAVRLVNGYAEEINAVVNCTLGAGLHADALEIVGAGPRGAVCRPGEARALTLSPDRAVWLRGDVEATGAGPVHVAVEITALDRTQVFGGACEVLPNDAATPDAPLVLRRTVLVRTPVEEEAAEAPGVAHQHWRWFALAPGARLVPGQYLRIEEEFTTALDLPPLSWSQALPATCRVGVVGLGRLDEIGRRRDEGGADLMYSVARPRAGTFRHVYHLAVVRPGACILPAPELKCGEQTFPVRLEPPELRLIVLDER